MAKIEIEVNGSPLEVHAKKALLDQIAKQPVDILEKLVLMDKPKSTEYLRNPITWAIIKKTLGV